MKQLSNLLVMVPLLLVLSGFQSTDTYQEIGEIERLQPELDELIPEDAVIEVLAEGFAWSEGPVWRQSEDYLLFSDIPSNTIYKWTEEEGLSVYLRPAGYIWSDPPGRELGTNGLVFDSEDRLVMADHGNRGIVRLNERIFTREYLANEYDGKRFNSPNDLVIHSSGDIYFTDPPFGLNGLHNSPSQELDIAGVYRISAEDGSVSLLTDEFLYPNGIALSPDEKTLYVGATMQESVIKAFDVQEDGSIANGRVFLDAQAMIDAGTSGTPDGMTVDQHGNIFTTGPGGVLVLSPDGTHLGTIVTGAPTANCAFGDDGSTLYITSSDKLLRVRLSTTGLGF